MVETGSMEIAMARRVLLPARILNLIPIVDAWMPAARPKRMAKSKSTPSSKMNVVCVIFGICFPNDPGFGYKNVLMRTGTVRS